MTLFDSLTLVTLAFYTAGTLCGLIGMTAHCRMARLAGTACVVAGFLVQTASMVSGSHCVLPEGLSYGAYLQLIAWFLILGGMIGWFKLKSVTPVFFTVPLALLLFCMAFPYQESSIPVLKGLSAPFYTLHIGALFASIGLMALGCCAGLIFLLAEHNIKSKSGLKGFWQDMPALSLLDKINMLAVQAGFPLYTLGLVAGYLWARPVFGTTLSGDPKEILSLVIWGLFAVLFHNRLVYGWKGRRPAKFMVALFMLSMLSIVFVNTFLTSHHSITRY